MKKLYDQREISRLLGISESQVRYWDRKGLIPHLEKSKGSLWFDFQALAAFRTVRELRRQGVSLAKIRKCVEKLRQMMPGLKQPLAEVRITLQRNRLILGKDRQRFTPEGQRCIDFDLRDEAPIPLPTDTFEDLFFQALEDEDEGRLQEARQKYETILAAMPEHVDALVNLGNLLYLSGSETSAAARYLQALGINPDHVEGNYNLANLLEGRGELASAAIFYQKAIQVDGEYADAHFNLAMVLEGVGDLRGAKVHWRRYLELNPASQWADYVRRRLEES
ncbi:MAG: MerR family transcriptional regulator [Deltaproteobacteria bacterium]|nr:MerR family transcriptional regulator [Deltaproteobacteria bacterium]